MHTRTRARTQIHQMHQPLCMSPLAKEHRSIPGRERERERAREREIAGGGEGEEERRSIPVEGNRKS